MQLSDNQEEIEIRAARSIIDHLLALLDQLEDLIVSVTFIRGGTSQESAFLAYDIIWRNHPCYVLLLRYLLSVSV